ncbi:hypothetical protein BgAZ_400540 [Babesia gibsoni]|uniref:Uncharacterized protein n=1 Tax=Babesia gibsoni TaxID=33632 RepID=A0AAD8PCZ0_BABGI|nr:hypothetical protein BgAZ_400540 [Babesia gibsoni]
MTGLADKVAQESATPRVRGSSQKYSRIPAVELINDVASTDWNKVAESVINSQAKVVSRHLRGSDYNVGNILWAYIQPQGDGATSTESTAGDVDTLTAKSEKTNNATKLRQRPAQPSTTHGDAAAKVASGLDMLFGSSNGKSHLFAFGEESTDIKLNRTLESCDVTTETRCMSSQYSSTTLEDCEPFSPYYAASVGSDFSSDMEDSKQVVSDEALRDLSRSPVELLRYKCERFFDHHRLVVKVRKLPSAGNLRSNTDSAKCGESKGTLLYPAYHFVTRQRNHMFEQLMRSRTFLDTRYNGCNEMRNSKSPFSLIELHDGILKHVESLRNDLCDPEFSGIYISVSTKAFESDSEFGRVRRSKTIAWALIELLKSNERCLKGLWVHPSVSAPATTALLSALLPYSIVASFRNSASNMEGGYLVKTFFAWLNDFDAFPRQALILLTSPDRLGLVKHYETFSGRAPSTCATKKSDSENKDARTSHVDLGVTDESCYCHEGANWDNLDRVIVGCTEQLMNSYIPKWTKLVPDQAVVELLDDLKRIVLPESISYNPIRTKESHHTIRDAEFTGLSPLQIRNLLVHLYGCRWKNRLKLSSIKLFREQQFATSVCKHEMISVLDDREERRKRRAQVVGQV